LYFQPFTAWIAALSKILRLRAQHGIAHAAVGADRELHVDPALDALLPRLDRVLGLDAHLRNRVAIGPAAGRRRPASSAADPPPCRSSRPRARAPRVRARRHARLCEVATSGADGGGAGLWITGFARFFSSTSLSWRRRTKSILGALWIASNAPLAPISTRRPQNMPTDMPAARRNASGSRSFAICGALADGRDIRRGARRALEFVNPMG
jgi:hypothetical protein